MNIWVRKGSSFVKERVADREFWAVTMHVPHFDGQDLLLVEHDSFSAWTCSPEDHS